MFQPALCQDVRLDVNTVVTASMKRRRNAPQSPASVMHEGRREPTNWELLHPNVMKSRLNSFGVRIQSKRTLQEFAQQAPLRGSFCADSDPPTDSRSDHATAQRLRPLTVEEVHCSDSHMGCLRARPRIRYSWTKGKYVHCKEGSRDICRCNKLVLVTVLSTGHEPGQVISISVRTLKKLLSLLSSSFISPLFADSPSWNVYVRAGICKSVAMHGRLTAIKHAQWRRCLQR